MTALVSAEVDSSQSLEYNVVPEGDNEGDGNEKSLTVDRDRQTNSQSSRSTESTVWRGLLYSNLRTTSSSAQRVSLE